MGFFVSYNLEKYTPLILLWFLSSAEVNYEGIFYQNLRATSLVTPGILFNAVWKWLRATGFEPDYVRLFTRMNL